jgi:hypothetical protein
VGDHIIADMEILRERCLFLRGVHGV